jgi:hypothetical protein
MIPSCCVPLIFIACTSFIVCGVQPISWGWSRTAEPVTRPAGWVVSVEMIGMTLGTLLCPLLMKRHGGRSLVPVRRGAVRGA